MRAPDRLATGRIVFLTGFMASGKSHFGHHLARLAGTSFHDLDEQIEREQGRSISALFRDDGEDAFRLLERETLERLVEGLRQAPAEPFAVLSTGGGTPCTPGVMEWMNERGVTVWLNPPFEVLVERLRAGSAHRPLVQGLEGEALVEAVRSRLALRAPYYRMAHHEITEADPDAAVWLNRLSNN